MARLGFASLPLWFFTVGACAANGGTGSHTGTVPIVAASGGTTSGAVTAKGGSSSGGSSSADGGGNGGAAGSGDTESCSMQVIGKEPACNDCVLANCCEQVKACWS